MDGRRYIEDICVRSKAASKKVAGLSTVQKNSALRAVARMLREKSSFIVEENERDMDAAKQSGVTQAFLDRLMLNGQRIEGMAVSVEEIAALDDPVGRVEGMSVRPSGIRVGRMRVPIGVIGVIFESRPNVTTDIAALCLKSGNSCILRGGSESVRSNLALRAVIADAFKEGGVPPDAVIMIDRVDRELVPVLLGMDKYIDIVIPRGGESLIQMVTRESSIPVIKHDKGVCHVYIDKSAEEDMAVRISVNAKVQRPGVCNAMETLLIHGEFPHKESLLKALSGKGVELRGCDRTVSLMPEIVKRAGEEDWSAEYLDMILSVKIVDSMDEAADHMARYGSGHSDAIVTSDYRAAERFLKEVDSAAVFVNASTRFHDGNEFGLGAEVGISTQKLHARGAMGIEGLTCSKYIVYGSGQVRS